MAGRSRPISKSIRPSPQSFHHSSHHLSHSPPTPLPQFPRTYQGSPNPASTPPIESLLPSITAPSKDNSPNGSVKSKKSKNSGTDGSSGGARTPKKAARKGGGEEEEGNSRAKRKDVPTQGTGGGSQGGANGDRTPQSNSPKSAPAASKGDGAVGGLQPKGEDDDETDDDREGGSFRPPPRFQQGQLEMPKSCAGSGTPAPGNRPDHNSTQTEGGQQSRTPLKLKFKMPPGSSGNETLVAPTSGKNTSFPVAGVKKTQRKVVKGKAAERPGINRNLSARLLKKPLRARTLPTSDATLTSADEGKDDVSVSDGDLRSNAEDGVGGQAQPEMKGYYDSSEGEDDNEDAEELTDVLVEIQELPPRPGKSPAEGAVVTWSDYDLEDFVSEGWPNEDDDAFWTRASSARPSSHHNRATSEEPEEMWFSKVSGHQDQDQSPDNDETSVDSGGESGDETDNESQALMLFDDWFTDPQALRQQGQNSDAETSMQEDGGDTTDSLDDDDHLALVKFGIEVADEGEGGRAATPPLTASMADVQLSPAPNHPQSNFGDASQIPSGSEDMTATISMEALSQDPQKTIAEAAKTLGVDEATAASILAGVGMSVLLDRQNQAVTNSSDVPRGRGRGRGRNIKAAAKSLRRVTTDTRQNHSRVAGRDQGQPTPDLAASCNEVSPGEGSSSGPQMGTFFVSPMTNQSAVIDGSSRPTHSPFSGRGVSRASSRRGRGSGSDRQPSPFHSRRRLSASSTTSATSAPSLFSGMSGSGFLPTSDAPPAEPMDLDDVLQPSVLKKSGSKASLTGDETTARRNDPPSNDDLSRWQRVPIGAFRSSRATDPTTSTRAFPAVNEDNQPTPGFFRSNRNTNTLRSTLSPRAAGINKRSKLRLSPVLLPVRPGRSASQSLIKSHKAKRKEKKRSRSPTLASPPFSPSSFSGFSHSTTASYSYSQAPMRSLTSSIDLSESGISRHPSVSVSDTFSLSGTSSPSFFGLETSVDIPSLSLDDHLMSDA